MNLFAPYNISAEQLENQDAYDNAVNVLINANNIINNKDEWKWNMNKKPQAGEAITSSIMEPIEPLPSFFKDILRKLEFSAQQSELWESPEDAGIVAIEYRALAMKLEGWMKSHG